MEIVSALVRSDCGSRDADNKQRKSTLTVLGPEIPTESLLAAEPPTLNGLWRFMCVLWLSFVCKGGGWSWWRRMLVSV